MRDRLLYALIILACIIALPALILGFIAGALAAGLVVSYRVGWGAVMPPQVERDRIEEDEDE